MDTAKGAAEPPKAPQKLPSYKRASRLTHPEDTVISLGPHSIGGEEFIVMAGPCSVEADPQMLGTAWDVKIGGAHIIRGGAHIIRGGAHIIRGGAYPPSAPSLGPLGK